MYQKVTNVASMDAWLGLLSTFIGTVTGWTKINDLAASTAAVMGDPPTGSNPDNRSTGRQLIATKGDCVAGLRSVTGGPGANRLYLFDGFGSVGSPTDSSFCPGNSGGGQISRFNFDSGSGAAWRGFDGLAGPFPTAYFFSDPAKTYVHCVLEIATGIFRHLTFGVLEKFGTWTGGGFYSGYFWNTGGLGNPTSGGVINSPSSSAHLIPFDNAQSGNNGYAWTVHYENGADKWIANTGDTTFGTIVRRSGRASVRGGINRMFMHYPESFFSGLIPLAPIMVGAVRQTDNPNTIRYIGRVPDLRMIDITNLSPADEFAIGSDTWKVFPYAAKNGGTGQYNSGVAGYAYKKVL
jgi:hypothetical protein